jgi:hypothetical protein
MPIQISKKLGLFTKQGTNISALPHHDFIH